MRPRSSNAIAMPKPTTTAGGGAGGGKIDLDGLNENELLELIQTGQVYYGAARRLIPIWAAAEMPEADVIANLQAAFNAVPQANRGPKWAKRFPNIPRWVKQGYAKVAKKRSTLLKALVAYFSDGPLWQGAVRYNEFTQTIELCDPFPPQPGRVIDHYRALREPGDVLRALIHVQDNGFPKTNQGAVWNALILAAEERTYHPVRAWLTQLRWDGAARCNRLFLDYFPGELPEPEDPKAPTGAEIQARDRMTAYLEKIAVCYMVGLVARIAKPGCKVDSLPVLVSPEAFNKSQGFRALCLEDAWFTDDVSPDLMDRDTKNSLRGKWIIELAEFPHARKDATRFKMFASRQVNRFRRPYDRAPHDWPRQCGFAATTNELDLISVTGNRRIWPFWLAGPVAVADIERDRDQLWAEAVALYRDDFPWWLPPVLETIAGEIAAGFVEADEWDESILEFLDQRYPVNQQTKLRAPFTLREVLRGIGFSFTPGEANFAGKADEMRVSRRLQHFGFRRSAHRARRNARATVWVAAPKK